MKRDNYFLIENLRHELHRHPELSYEEVWTKQHLMGFLREHTKLELHDGGRYFYAVYRAEKAARKRRAIAFRADFDALPIEDEIDQPYRSCVPGVGHKCGHDGHAAALCGLGLELAELRLDRDVYMVFQHAEETGQGAVEAKAFLLENPDIEEIFAFHNQVGARAGEVLVASGACNCASKGMSVFMKGTPTHASLPERGTNPVFALAKVIDAVPALIEPEKYDGLVLCTVCQLSAGSHTFGTAASEGLLRMTIRAEVEAEMDALQQRIETLCREEAEAAGLTLCFDFQDEFPETRNSANSVEKVYQAAEKLGYSVHEKPTSRGSEDFGHYTKVVPGALFYIGGGIDVPSFHTSGYDFTDVIMENAVEMFKALLAL